MFEIPFYHGLIRQAVVGFGAVFSQLKVIRTNPNDPTQPPQIVAVPIAYAPKEKFLVRVTQDPNQDGFTYITLPRMAFEITGYTYDSSRMVSRNNQIQMRRNDVITGTFTPVPYNLDFTLHILTKGTEDGLAIIEQILPKFTPEYTITINSIPEFGFRQDVPLILNGISVSDDYEGDFTIRRLVTHTLNFTAKINLFDRIRQSGLIKNTITDVKQHQTHVATMDADGNIVVDQWIETPDRSNLNVNMSGSTGTTISTSGVILRA